MKKYQNFILRKSISFRNSTTIFVNVNAKTRTKWTVVNLQKHGAMKLVYVDAKMLKMLMIAKHLKCNLVKTPTSLKTILIVFYFH